MDSFQGREKDVIVFSTVRSRPSGFPFAGDKYRMNVLLTRAKRGLVGVGSKIALKSEDLWSKWLQQVCVMTEDEFSASIISKSSRQASSKRHQYRKEPGNSQPRRPRDHDRRQPGDSEPRRQGDHDRRQPGGYHRGQAHSRPIGQNFGPSKSQSYGQPGAVGQDHSRPGDPQQDEEEHMHPGVHDHSGHDPRGGGGYRGRRGRHRPPREGAIRDQDYREPSSGSYGRPRDGRYTSPGGYSGGSRAREHGRQ